MGSGTCKKEQRDNRELEEPPSKDEGFTGANPPDKRISVSMRGVRTARVAQRAGRPGRQTNARDVQVRSHRVAGCQHCERLTDFVLPNEIIEATIAGNLTIFAGAGVSTEGRHVYKTTLYDDIAEELNIDPRTGPPFPTLMSRYCGQQDGRRKLILAIRKRLDYLRSFPEVHRQATRFHEELATLPFIKDIFTTNWDDLFEQVCGAMPIIAAPDFVFWDLPVRKVYKLHGSVSSYSTLVLTEDDYERSYQALSTGVIGANLRLALATKTFIFIGYSLGDPDLERLYRTVTTEMGGLGRAAYVVTLDESRRTEYERLGLVPIIADGAHFVEALKSVLIERRLMFPDSMRRMIFMALRHVSEVHHNFLDRLDMRRWPYAVYTAAYQDGLIHALQHQFSMYDTGESDPHYLHHMIHSYERLRREELRDRDYYDAAYIDGYIIGLQYPLVAWRNPRVKLPSYYAYGEGKIWTRQECREALRRAKQDHPRAYSAATKIVERKIPSKGIVLHHIPFL